MSPKVRMPSDSMTPGQLKQLNSEVELYSLGRPMKWAQLLNMPADLRKQYLEKLRDEYRASQVMVADMLEISVHTFRKKCKDWGIKFQPNGGHINDKVVESWSAFLGREYAPAKAKPQEIEETQEPATPEPLPLVPRSGSMTFHGPACQALRTMQEALRDTTCTLTITWETEE